MFDHHVLDMVELGVEKFTSMFDVQVNFDHFYIAQISLDEGCKFSIHIGADNWFASLEIDNR